MRRTLACAAASLVALVGAVGAQAAATHDDRGGRDDRGGHAERGESRAPFTVAVIGDTPYGAAQEALFPTLVGSINADPTVDLVLHLGDVKAGSTLCSDAYFGFVSGLFATFADPLVYTPGDNEWTDCHRANNGGYLPTERLAKLREVFFPRPGVTLGQRAMRVQSQARQGFPENQLWERSDVVFSAVHVVGSNNDLAPWGTLETGNTALREAEHASRLQADLAWLDRTFRLADEEDAKAVVLAMQADMWDAFSVANGLPLNGFDPIVQRIADRAAAFGKPVLILQGDSHGFLVDQPLAGGSPVHHVTTSAPNVTRIVVEGAQTADEWLRLTVDPRRRAPSTFAWERVVFTP